MVSAESLACEVVWRNFNLMRKWIGRLIHVTYMDESGDAYVGEYDNGGDEDRRQVKHLVVAQVETVQGGEAGDGGRQAG